MPAEKLLLVMANTGPRNGQEAEAPICQALLAAAMDVKVEAICTGISGETMRRGAASKPFVKPGPDKAVHDFIEEAHDAGAGFFQLFSKL